MVKDTITFKCKCGSDKFAVPPTRRPEDTIKCVRCGAVGKYGNVVESGRRQAKAAVEKQLKDALKKAGFKLK